MRLNLYSIIFNPFFLIFITVFLGVWAGNWKKLGKMKPGVGGPLFIGLIIGWVVYSLADGISEGDKAYNAAEAIISKNMVPFEIQSFMLMLFVAAIGLLASKDLGIVIKKYGFRFIVLGIVITLSGALMSFGIVLLNSKSNIYEASGVYTGALTSSPGLGAAIEKSIQHAEMTMNNYDNLPEVRKIKILQIFNSDNDINVKITDNQKNSFVNSAAAGVGTGYAVAYPFGMLMVILAITIIPKIFRINIAKEKEQYFAELDQMRKGVAKNELKPVPFDLKSYILICFVGYLTGMVEIYLGSAIGYFNLGSIGGVLIVSIVFGYIGKIGPFVFRMDSKILGIIRDISLSCYVGMIGLSYGYQVIRALFGAGLYIVLYSIAISTSCILIGFILGRYVLRINWVVLSGAICGGMTSTPGLGIAVDFIGSDEPAAGYAASYPSAIAGMVIFTVIMYNIPV